MQEPEQNKFSEGSGNTDPFGYEEFDISKFDFSIADPGEDPSEQPAPVKPDAPQPSSFPPEEILQDLPLSPKPKKEPPLRNLHSFAPVDRKMLIRKGKRYLRYALRPSGLYENIGESLWVVFLTGCCLFGGLFYLLVGLDWASAGLITAGRVWLMMLTGLLLGGTVSLAFAGGASLLAKLCKEDHLRPFRLISAVAGAGVYPAVVLCLGLLLGLFGLSVSMSFGLVALLWWIFNLMEVLKDLIGNRFFPIITFILLWGMGLLALISVTFMLK